MVAEGHQYRCRRSRSHRGVGDIVEDGIEVERVLEPFGMGCLWPFVAA